MSVKQMNPKEYLKGYKIGFQHGEESALIKFQQSNKNTDLPSNETMFKIFNLLFECQKKDEETSSVYMNQYERYANYITKNWDKNE